MRLYIYSYPVSLFRLNTRLTSSPVVDAAPHSESFSFPSSVYSPPLDKIPSMNYSTLKKAYKERVIPELREEDLEESFVRGKVARVDLLT